VEVWRTDDPAEGWDWVLSELACGKPLLCWADMAELPYLRVRMHMSRHDIVVIGVDRDAETVWVVDNDRPDPQEISFSALAAARASRGFPEPTRHTCYPMRFPTRLPDRISASASAVKDVAATFEASPTHADRIARAPATAHHTGLDGVAAFAQDFGLWPDLFVKRDDVDSSAADLHTALQYLAAFIEKAGTGGGLFRRLQATFLTELAETCRLPAVWDAALAYQQLAAHWTAIASEVAGKEPETARHRWSRARSLVDELPEREEYASTRLVLAARELD
jgi:hypothetical protein